MLLAFGVLLANLSWVGSSQAASVIRCSAGVEIPAPSSEVEGKQTQPGVFSVSVQGPERTFKGNGLPVGTSTGVWPELKHLELDLRVPANPRRRTSHGCLPRGVVGVAKNGVLVHSSATAAGKDATRTGPRDICGGTRIDGIYAYRGLMPCLGTGRVGWARDGFELWRVEGVSARSLDRCHGRTDVRNGKLAYRYYVTASYPYTLSCFRGEPTRWNIKDAPPSAPDVPVTPPEDTAVVADPQPPRAFAVDIEDLKQPFDPERYVYTLDCSDPVTVRVTDPPAPASLDGAPSSTHSFEREVSLTEGQALSLTVGDRTYSARCLPADFPGWSFERRGEASYPHYLFSPSLGTDGPYYAVVADADGVPVWWKKTVTPALDTKPLGKDVVWSTYGGPGFGQRTDVAFEQRTLAGELVHRWQTVGTPTDHHEFRALANGNALMVSYQLRDGVDLSAFGGPQNATVLDADIQEVTPQQTVAWEWNSKDHIALEETGRWYAGGAEIRLADGRQAYDIVHINAVEPTRDGDVLFSGRHLDAIYRIDRASGAVDWKLGGTQRPESLTVAGDDQPLGGQHDVRELGDGSVTVHDNGTGLGRPPRARRFALDLTARTATVVESITDPSAPNSGCCGSARRAANGNWLMSWGLNSYIDELTAAGDLVLSFKFDRGFSYRAVGVPQSTWSSQELAAGMDAQNPR